MVIEKECLNDIIQLVRDVNNLGPQLLRFLQILYQERRYEICFFKSYSYSKWKLLQIFDRTSVIHGFYKELESKRLLPISYTIDDENPITLVLNIEG